MIGQINFAPRTNQHPSSICRWSRRVSREDTTTSAQRSLLGRAGSDASRGAPDRRDAGWSQRAPPGNSPTSPRRSELRRGNSGDASPSAAGASDSRYILPRYKVFLRYEVLTRFEVLQKQGGNHRKETPGGLVEGVRCWDFQSHTQTPSTRRNPGTW